MSCLFLFSCEKFSTEDLDAEDKLVQILSAFPMPNGVLCSTREGTENLLTDAMLERMFFYGKDVSALTEVESAAVYFSRRFSKEEIVVLKLYDLSYRDSLINLCEVRASKKENAIVCCDGVYVYLICTNNNEEIRRYLK